MHVDKYNILYTCSCIFHTLCSMPYSSTYIGSMVLLLVLMLLAVLVLERWKKGTLASKALRSGRPGSTPKKVKKKNTPFRTFHTLVRVMNVMPSKVIYIYIYISTSYDINLFRFRQMKLTNLPGGLKMSHGPSGQPRLNAVSMAPRVRVGKNLKLWLGNQPQNWSLTHELPSGDWSSDPIREKPTRNSWRQASKVVWADLLFFRSPYSNETWTSWMKVGIFHFYVGLLWYYALQNIHHFSILLLLRPSTQCTTDLPRSRRSPNWQNSLFSTPTALQGASRTLQKRYLSLNMITLDCFSKLL